MDLVTSVLAASVLFVATAPGRATAALPPGYEDDMYCPPNACSVFTWTRTPYSYVGGRGLWEFCYNPATDVTTAAAFGGSKTVDGAVPPRGWVEPVPCTAAEYSECDADADCGRSAIVGTRGEDCRCYATSQFHPFTLPYVLHHKSHCTEGACDDLVPRCVADANAGGTCQLQIGDPPTPNPVMANFPNPNVDNKVGGMCLYDEDCITKQRSVAPLKSYRTGPKMCECYATSYQWGFNENEGKATVVQANCNTNTCHGTTSVCDIQPGDNGFGECALVGPPTRLGSLKNFER